MPAKPVSRANEDQPPLRILSIGAHPADVFDQSGGTMAHHVERGDWVGCCVLTHGARVHDKVITNDMFHAQAVPEDSTFATLLDERAQVKADEVRKACAILGVKDVYFFGADDAVLLPDEPTVRRLARFLREVRPDVVLTHFPLEGGGVWNPHAAAGQIVLMAIHLALTADRGDERPPHRVMHTFYWGQGAGAAAASVWDAHRAFFSDVIIDISDVIDKKLACLDCLVSQGYAGAYARKRMEINDGHFGRQGNVPYGEAFISERAQTYRYLPISEYTRRNARMSDHQRMQTYSYMHALSRHPSEANA